MKGLILAAGLGTRLRPLSENKAKPALPVAGVPTLWYGAWHMARTLGVTDIAINCGHAADTLKSAVEDEDLKRLTGVNFHVSDETGNILGSSGALWKIRDWLGDSPLAVFNGDSICFPDWIWLRKWHQKAKGLMTLHLIRHQNSAEAYTEVTCDAHGRVTNFGAKSKSGVMFSGAYIIEAQALKRLPDGYSNLMETLLKPLSDERQLFGIVEDNRPWFDTGTVKTFFEANFEVPAKLNESRVLIEAKMRETKPGVWVPKSWPTAVNLNLKAPCVLEGEYSDYQKLKASLGPRLLCLNAPKNVESSQQALQNGIWFEDQFLST